MTYLRDAVSQSHLASSDSSLSVHWGLAPYDWVLHFPLSEDEIIGFCHGVEADGMSFFFIEDGRAPLNLRDVVLRLRSGFPCGNWELASRAGGQYIDSIKVSSDMFQYESGQLLVDTRVLDFLGIWY
jgi:hypothetical protein